MGRSLVVDGGNSRIKVAVFECDKIVAYEVFGLGEASAYARFLERWGGFEGAIISSTSQLDSAFQREATRRSEFTLLFDNHSPVPIAIDYKTPDTLGSDRIAGAVAGAMKFPGSDVLIVDFGTAITVDLVSAEGAFCGGVISPGMSLRFKALNDYTSQLPLCGATDNRILMGQTTREAIEAGVINGITFEIESYIERIKDEKGEIYVIFTGGDAEYFEKRIKNAIFAEPYLVLNGLFEILRYNKSLAK